MEGAGQMMAQSQAPYLYSGNGQANAIKQATMTERLHRDLCSLREVIFANVHRLQSMADRTLGPTPQPAESSQQPKPSGSLGEIAQQLELLQVAAKRQADIITQLENVL